jgi:tRNA 2-selenouridine synthase SelU
VRTASSNEEINFNKEESDQEWEVIINNIKCSQTTLIRFKHSPSLFFRTHSNHRKNPIAIRVNSGLKQTMFICSLQHNIKQILIHTDWEDNNNGWTSTNEVDIADEGTTSRGSYISVWIYSSSS